MAQTLPFAEVVEAVDQLTIEEQETLLAIVQRRLVERGRKQVVQDVAEARQEFAAGGCRPVRPDDLLLEI